MRVFEGRILNALEIMSIGKSAQPSASDVHDSYLLEEVLPEKKTCTNTSKWDPVVIHSLILGTMGEKTSGLKLLSTR